jgi:hypothetical protein
MKIHVSPRQLPGVWTRPGSEERSQRAAGSSSGQISGAIIDSCFYVEGGADQPYAVKKCEMQA